MLFIAYYTNDKLFELCFRIEAPFVIAIPIIFLLISFATILNHFKPDVYLELSVYWKHTTAIPILGFSFILIEQLSYRSCPEEDFMECQGSKIRNFLMIPASGTSFLSQLIVIIDVICGWKNIYRKLRRLFQPNLVTAISNGDLEGTQMSTISPQPLDQHLVSCFYWIKELKMLKIF